MPNPYGLPSRDERPHLTKTKPCKDESFYKEWALRHEWCQCCGLHGSRSWPPISTHHIIKSGRAHEACNLLRLCARCHSLAEGEKIRTDPNDRTSPFLPQLTVAICLRLKLLREPDEYDAERLAVLYKKPLPDLEAVPRFFELLFRKRHPDKRDQFDAWSLAV